MRFKLKHMIFGKIAIILCLCLVLNNTFTFKSYAEESIAVQNPLFIPITSLVTAVALGSGIIGKNAVDSVDKLVDSVVSNIKSSEVQKSESNAGYDSPYRVINGGEPEKPNNSNKNGKWVALGGGAIASGELWANKETVIDIMSKINSLGGYNSFQNVQSYISLEDIEKSGSASNISLQLAKLSNACVTQWDSFLHSTFWNDKNVTPDDCVFTVGLNLNSIFTSNPSYPALTIRVIQKSDSWSYWKLVRDNLRYGTFSNSYGSCSRWYISESAQTFGFYNKDYVQSMGHIWNVDVFSRSADGNFSWSYGQYTNANGADNSTINIGVYGSWTAYIGPVNKLNTPWQFTQNVYNVNQTFDENFSNWLQGQIQLIGQGLMDAVRLGITTTIPSWNPTQEQIQTGSTPASVIYQYINNYENPENIPEEEEEPDNPVVVPPAIEEPQPTNDYLGNFLLPESITTKFPFCIPFDVARALRLFSVSQREAPKWECDLNYGSSTYHVVIDLAMFNDVASFIRPLEYIVFLVGLALGTRSLIRG